MTSEINSAPDSVAQKPAPLAVLMPAYNEAAGIEEAVSEVCRDVLDQLPGAYLIVVDDGSKDKTGEILDALSQADSRIHVIHKANSGHGPSLIRALNEADSDYVFMIDSDMQIPLDSFASLWQKATAAGVDGVFGIRSNRQDPRLRIFLSRLIAVTLGLTFRVKLADANVPFKIFRRKIWTDLYDRIQDDTLLVPSMTIAVYARRRGFNIIDVPVAHRARVSGEPSLRILKLISFCLKGFRQLMNLRDLIL